MTTEYSHDYHVGDAVLLDINGAQIPGVIADEQGGRFQVQLAEPWVDESGGRSDTVWADSGQLQAYIEESSSGTQALPG